MVVSRQHPLPVASPRAQQDLPLKRRLVDARLADPPKAGLKVPRELVDEKFVRQGHAEEVLRLGPPNRPPLRPGLVAPQLDVHDLPKQPELGPTELHPGALAANQVSRVMPIPGRSSVRRRPNVETARDRAPDGLGGAVAETQRHHVAPHKSQRPNKFQLPSPYKASPTGSPPSSDPRARQNSEICALRALAAPTSAAIPTDAKKFRVLGF